LVRVMLVLPHRSTLAKRWRYSTPGREANKADHRRAQQDRGLCHDGHLVA
jgi:hypothetical protein